MTIGSDETDRIAIEPMANTACGHFVSTPSNEKGLI
jgi:hypothetical protein